MICDSAANVERLGSLLNEQLTSAKSAAEGYLCTLTAKVRDPEFSKIIYSFSDPGSPPYLVVTAKMWEHIESPSLQYIYLTCRVGSDDIQQIIAKAARPMAGKSFCKVIDYAGNDFPFV